MEKLVDYLASYPPIPFSLSAGLLKVNLLNLKNDAFLISKTYFCSNTDVLNSHLQFLFDSLEGDRLRIMDEIASLSPEQLNYTPGDKWSIAQILAHLVAAERLSVRYLNKKILGIDSFADTGIAEEAKMLLLKISQRFPFKFRAPKVVVLNTLSYNSLQELNSDWEKERSELRDLLEKFEDRQIRRKVYRHVRAGMLNIEQTLIFFHEHHRHHLPQIKRLIGIRA